jgi:hypothetical protein
MRSLLIPTLVLLIGCGGFGRPARMKTANEYVPTIAVAAAFANLDKTQPAPSPTPIVPGLCSNCRGTGKIGDGTVMVPCPVCGGDGVMNQGPSGPAAFNDIKIPTEEPVSSTQSGASDVRAAGSVSTPPPSADTYTRINWVTPEQSWNLMLTTGKPVLFHCTDLVTCPICIQLERTVFKDPTFIKATRDFICVHVPWEHPWRPGLTQGAGKPCDVYCNRQLWNAGIRSRCPTDSASYIATLNLYKGRLQNATASSTDRVYSLSDNLRNRQLQFVSSDPASHCGLPPDPSQSWQRLDLPSTSNCIHAERWGDFAGCCSRTAARQR